VIAEPGRFLVAEAGCFVVHVIGTAMRNGQRWMHWDAGVFWGPVRDDRWPALTTCTRTKRECRFRVYVAGPTCDSVDVCMRDQMLPEDIAAGDSIYVFNAGAYTTAYASEFNGFALPQVIVIDSGPQQRDLAALRGRQQCRAPASVLTPCVDPIPDTAPIYFQLFPALARRD